MADAKPKGTSKNYVLRVAAVWGTTVLKVRALRRGQSFLLGDHRRAVLPIPDGLDLPEAPLRAVPGGWELDARGARAGVLLLRGREEDPQAIAATGAPVAVLPGDHGLVQYGLFALFFQYTSAPAAIPAGMPGDLLANLGLFSSALLHAGAFGLIYSLTMPPALLKPLELTDESEMAARFGLRRPVLFEEPKPTPGETAGGQGIQDQRESGGGQKIKGDEGKFGARAKGDRTELPGELRPTESYGGLSAALEGSAGKEIQQTLKSIQSVSDALAGLKGNTLVLGDGGGTGLKGGGSGGGGTGAGVAYGSGSMNTGLGFGNGGGGGSGNGGTGGSGTGTGTGNGGGGGASKPAERGVAVSAGTAQAKGGLTPDQVQRVVRARMGALRACYETQAQRNPNLKGGVTMRWQIGPDGRVSNAGVASSTLRDATVEGCVQRQVSGWRFPTADAPTTVTAYPFKFGVGG